MDALPILKRVGTVLAIAGFIDIAVMVSCIFAGVAYSSSFNIFAVIAGFFLIRGNLRAASIVRRAAVFFFFGFGSAIVLVLVVQPLDLTMTQIRLNPWTFFMTGIIVILMLSLLLWVSKELGRQEIVLAFTNAGMKPPNARRVAIVTVAFIGMIATVAAIVLNDDASIEKAKRLAQQEADEGHKFHVNSLKISVTDKGRRITATVVSWNENEIKDILVEWSE